MPQITVSFSDETLADLDDIADCDHMGDRDEAVASMLDDWIAER